MLDPAGTSKVGVEDESSGIVMCSSTHNQKNYYRSLSPESKTQAIERGQRELMEMVRNMPESTYELTLKDLVVEKKEQQPKVDEAKTRRKREGVSISNNNSSSRKVVDHKRIVSGKKNIDSGGFYLKLGFPISLGSNNNNNNNIKKKKESLGNSNNNNNSSKVSDKEWWKKKSESNNSGSSIKSYDSSSSNSNRSNNSRHEMSASSCWPFIRR